MEEERKFKGRLSPLNINQRKNKQDKNQSNQSDSDSSISEVNTNQQSKTHHISNQKYPKIEIEIDNQTEKSQFGQIDEYTNLKLNMLSSHARSKFSVFTQKINTQQDQKDKNYMNEYGTQSQFHSPREYQKSIFSVQGNSTQRNFLSSNNTFFQSPQNQNKKVLVEKNTELNEKNNLQSKKNQFDDIKNSIKENKNKNDNDNILDYQTKKLLLSIRQAIKKNKILPQKAVQMSNQMQNAMSQRNIISPRNAISPTNANVRINNMSSQISSQRQIGSQKRIGYVQSFDDRILVLLELVQSKKQVIQSLKDLKKSESLAVFASLIQISVELNDFNLFFDTLDIISNIYQMFGDLKSAIHVQNYIRVASGICRNYRRKIICLKNLGNLAKKLKNYLIAKNFFKKALQYSWMIGDLEEELNIYEDLGIISYFMMDTQMANEFHQRMIRGITEKSLVDQINKTSMQKEPLKQTNYQQISNNRLKNYEKEFLGQPIMVLDYHFIYRLQGFPFSFVQVDSDEIPEHVTNPYMLENRQNFELTNRQFFLNQNDEFFLLENIINNDPEMFSEVSTPRLQSHQLNTEPKFFGFSQRNNSDFGVVQRVKTEIRFDPNRVPKRHDIKKKEITTFYLNDNDKKKPLDELLKDRNKNQKISEKKFLNQQANNMQIGIQHKRKIQINDLVRIGHISTNRYVDNFYGSVNIAIKSPIDYFDKMIANKLMNQQNY